MRIGACLIAAFSISLALGCSPSPSPADAAIDAAIEAGSCDALASSARSEVSQAISDHLACATDTDCVLVALAASCFDFCTRTVNSAGVTDVDAAKARVDSAQCKQFVDQGCRFDIPPCVPPDVPHCVAGQCQSSP